MTVKQNRRWLLGILVLAIISAFITFTSRDFNLKLFHLDTRAHLGLDIQGGLRLILQPDVDLYNKQHPTSPWGPQQLSQVRQIIENRVNSTGVAEPLIITNPSANQIIVELPGIRNKNQAIHQLKSTANLQFYLLPKLGHGNGVGATWAVEHQKDPVTHRSEDVLVHIATGKPVTPQELQDEVFSNPDLLVTTGAHLLPDSRVEPDINRGNAPVISFHLDNKGAEAFQETTRAHIGDHLAIFLDNKLLTAPVINNIISDSGEIDGSFTFSQAKALSDNLNAGALPVPLKLLETRNLEATLGKDAVRTTSIAGGVAMVLVLVFMLYFYRLPGILADVALFLYTIFSFALFKVYPVTLTLPGIAGFILSIGMAVDANILIFERFREELRQGKPLRGAIDTGFKRAFTAIFDSNVCTLITCSVLYSFGSGPIRGFALTLGLGVAVSMFTAITVTRTFLFALVDRPWAQNPNLYGLKSRDYHLRAMQFPYRWLAASMLVIIPGLIFWGMGGIKPSIDFQGGTELTISYANKVDAGEIQKRLDSLGRLYRDSRVVISEDPLAPVNKNLAIVTTPALSEAQRTQVLNALTNNGADLAAGQTLQNVEYANVSGTISRQLTRQAFLSILYASALIVLYLAFRFSIEGFMEGLKYGVCAVGALVHDVAVVWGAFAFAGKLFNWQIDSLFVTAMLTVIGFSVHDTIIVFDRIRENLMHPVKGENFVALTDRSINQTISRSLKTSATVLLVLAMLWIFGSIEVQHFAAALFVGILSGTYSSIFNASVLLVLWKRKDMPSIVTQTPGTSASTRSQISVQGDKPLVAPVQKPQAVPTPAAQPSPSATSAVAGADTAETPSGEGEEKRTVRRQPQRRRRM